MPENAKLTKPWLVAVWPGMGHVAITAGYYLMAKLGMHQVAEFAAHELFDAQHVEVDEGVIRAGRLPRSRLFAWRDPRGEHDIVVFIGEAQPPAGNHAFCRRLVDYATELGVERIFTFAAMATEMEPGQPSRVFGAATDQEGVEELRRLELEILRDGQIHGLNGVLLGIAAEHGFRGTCLLGEMPHVFTQLSFPRASLAVLEAFDAIAGTGVDLGELAAQAETVDTTLGELLDRARRAVEEQASPHEAETYEDLAEEETHGEPTPTKKEKEKEEPRLAPEDEQRVERLFEESARDRSKAFELKQELDRLGLFEQYEDRFLDLFKES